MSRQVVVAMSDQKLAEIDVVFATQFGMPVLDNKERCIGSLINIFPATI